MSGRHIKKGTNKDPAVVGGHFAGHSTQQGRKGTDTHSVPGYDQELDLL